MCNIIVDILYSPNRILPISLITNLDSFHIKYQKIGKSLFYNLELSQKSDFQLSTTKLDNISHSTIETR